MRIPTGSRLHLNGWAIQHDAARHEDPDTFIPERYADDNSTSMQCINSADVTKRDHFAFGAGRRICPGYSVAERSLGLAITRILWAFDVKASGEAKYPLNNLEWRGTFPGLPGPEMPVVMVPKGEERVKVIREAMGRAEAERGVMGVMGRM
jgi:cytochrome P450